jgi:hypothetical protein
MTTTTGTSIRALAAATDGGKRGACLFALDTHGTLSFTAQEQAGGFWRLWQGPSFGGQPAPGTALAVAGQNDGQLMLAMLDAGGHVWTLPQRKAGGGWAGWAGPGIASQPRPFTALAAGQLSGPRGIALMASDADGQVWTCYQMNPGAAWSGWTTGLATASGGQPFAAGPLALADQGNGALILFTLAAGKVAALPQRPDALWGPWSGPGLASQPADFTALCACRGGAGGARLWTLDTKGHVWTLAQQGAGGAWGAWQQAPFARAPDPFVRLAAADQGNGAVALLAAGEKGDVWAIAETSPGGAWGKWRQLPPLPPS